MTPPVRRRTRRFDLLVVGHTNVDQFLDVSSLPKRDRTVPIRGSRARLGGTAANIALAAAHWGVRVALSSRVGGDFPEAFRAGLREGRVDVSGLERVPGGRSPTCYIVEDGRGSQLTLIDQGVMGNEADSRVPIDLIRASRWVHLATGDPARQLRILQEARHWGVPVSADPAQEVHYRWRDRPIRTLVRGSEILFGNSPEIRRIAAAFGFRRPQDLVSEVPLVVETRGRAGVTAHSRSGAVSLPASSPRQLSQVTGAGDAFRGGFYAGWFGGQALRRCLAAGVRSARAWVEAGGRLEHTGTQRIYRP